MPHHVNISIPLCCGPRFKERVAEWLTTKVCVALSKPEVGCTETQRGHQPCRTVAGTHVNDGCLPKQERFWTLLYKSRPPHQENNSPPSGLMKLANDCTLSFRTALTLVPVFTKVYQVPHRLYGSGFQNHYCICC